MSGVVLLGVRTRLWAKLCALTHLRLSASLTRDGVIGPWWNDSRDGSLSFGDDAITAATRLAIETMPAPSEEVLRG